MTQLALVIDLNVCVGCHACVTSCKEWNTSGTAGPMADMNPYGLDPTGTFFNRVQTFEVGHYPNTETVHFPKSCLHCEDPPCVPVCPTGASYKREEDGIVLVDRHICIGCRYCMAACPYGARELDRSSGTTSKNSGQVVGRSIAVHAELVKGCRHHLGPVGTQLGLPDLGIGEDESQHGSHLRMDHATAFGHPNNLSPVNLAAANLDPGIGSQNSGSESLEPGTHGQLLAARADLFDRQLNPDHPGGSR
jgi:Fe-S-cluster-containing dehydrogenase component